MDLLYGSPGFRLGSVYRYPESPMGLSVREPQYQRRKVIVGHVFIRGLVGGVVYSCVGCGT